MFNDNKRNLEIGKTLRFFQIFVCINMSSSLLFVEVVFLGIKSLHFLLFQRFLIFHFQQSIHEIIWVTSHKLSISEFLIAEDKSKNTY